MKKLLTLLFIILLTKITCFSQTTSTEINSDSIVSITSDQLRYTNLIFAEHEKLLVENDLLYKQIFNYKNKLELSKQVDSLRIIQINEYENIINEHSKQIQDLTNSISKKDKTILGLEIGGITVTVGLILALILR